MTGNGGDTKRDSAVALSYGGTGAPRVTAKGQGELARRIVALAERNGIPLRQDPELTALLARVPLDSEIPEELYVAVAEVIAFAYRLSDEWPRISGPRDDAPQ